MYPDGTRETQLSELRRLLGLRPPLAEPPADPPPFRLREQWEPARVAAEPGDDEGWADDETDYDEDDADEFAQPRYGRGAARLPGTPPLGSYESRRNALHPPKRRRPFRFVLPVLALAAIGFGAVKLLAVRPDTRIAIRGDQGSPTSAASTPAGKNSSPNSQAPNAAGTTSFNDFPSYPGQQSRNGGQVAIGSVAAADGTRLAVGNADGYPAIWRQGQGNAWSLAETAVNGVLAGRPGNETMIAVTHGQAGWLAVGDVVSGAEQHPVVVTSADGEVWRAADESPAFAAGGLYAYAAAAGRIDYVVVGEQVTGATATAATWWSAGLGAWHRGGNGGLDSSGKPSEMFAVAVGPDRFIAVGAHGSRPAVWASSDGQQWTVSDLALPAGATKAVLRQVVANGARVVATGNAVTAKGTVAFAEMSDDDGTSWHEADLSSPGPQAAVTALTASNGGFAAAGQSGRSGDPAAIVWTSADGMSWAPARSVPAPAGAQVRVITGLTSAGSTLIGIGVASAQAGERPVVYTAPAP
jgi:hypothetical protein